MSETNTNPAPLTREDKLRAKHAMLTARIAADTETANDIATELNNMHALQNLVPGSAVIVKLGRKFKDKDTTRYEPGIIVGIKEDDEGSKLYKAQIGEGFSSDIVVVNAAGISIPEAPAAA